MPTFNAYLRHGILPTLKTCLWGHVLPTLMLKLLLIRSSHLLLRPIHAHGVHDHPRSIVLAS